MHYHIDKIATSDYVIHDTLLRTLTRLRRMPIPMFENALASALGSLLSIVSLKYFGTTGTPLDFRTSAL
jgi:hypothetical protein